MDLISIIQKVGLSEKASKVYLAILELGEASVLDISKQSGLKRTTIYYVLNELITFGAILPTKRKRKIYYIAEEPRFVLKRARERSNDFEEYLEDLEGRKHAVYHKPRIFYLFGPAGFKQVWELVFSSKNKNFSIITDPRLFREFVRDKYTTDEIIKTKKKLGFQSRQLLVRSEHGKIIARKDKIENRISKFLPNGCEVPFTEIICHEFTAFISPRKENLIMVVENELFSKTRQNIFDTLWSSIK